MRAGATTVVVSLLVLQGTAWAGLATPPSRVEDVIERNRIGQQLITLINFTALPGISGGRYSVTRGQPGPDYDFSKLNIGGSTLWKLESQRFDIHLEGGFGYLKTDENSFGLSDGLLVKTDRNIYSGAVGAGLSVPLFDYFTVRPIVRVALSQVDNRTKLGEVDIDSSIDEILRFDWSLKAVTVGLALQLRYDRMFGERRVESRITYTHAYTDVFDAPSNSLAFSGHNDVITALGRFTVPTGMTIFQQPLFWNVFSTATTLWGEGSDALGFSYFFEFGAGLDLEVPDVPLIRVLRLRGSGIVGGNITGWSLGVGLAF